MSMVGSRLADYPATLKGPVAAVVAASAAYLALMAWLLQLPYNVAGGVVVAHVLALVTVPILMWLTRNESDRRMRRVIMAALIAKLVGTLVRYAVLVSVYAEGDALEYDRVGAGLAQFFRSGDFSVDLGQRIIGTGFIEILTGIIYTLTGSTRLGGFLVYSWLGFWGLYLFYRAFRLACPSGEHRRYALLLFFLPSMLFWPSSIGKEAWMTLCLGSFAYGAARLVAHRGQVFPWIVAGTVGSAMVRPHVTLIAVASLMAGYLLTGAKRSSYARPLSKMIGIVVLIGVLAFAFGAVQDFFRLDEERSIEEVLNRTQERTSKGGSEFAPPGARSPVQLPLAIFSVIFRPLPFEAGNLQAFVASLEGVFLLVLFLRRWRRLGNLVPRRQAPYLAFVTTYSLLFTFAFSNVSNFGILARQRTQLIPLLLVVLAVPHVRRTTASNRDPASSAGLPSPHRRTSGEVAAHVVSNASMPARLVRNAHLPVSYATSLISGLRERKRFADIETYRMFVGYGRSGHSLVGALLDAHPEAVIAHELDAARYFRAGFTRNQVYWLILRNDRAFARGGATARIEYTYAIPNQWQGRHRRLRVIGDTRRALLA